MKRITPFVLTFGLSLKCVLCVGANSQNYTSDCDRYAYVKPQLTSMSWLSGVWRLLGLSIPPV